MQQWFFDEVVKGISTKRLEVYRQNGCGDFETLARYIWNQRLCESIYPALETLEVLLRNAVHEAASRRFLTDTWFDTCGLDTSERVEIEKAKNELRRERKPLETGRIIAELSFGFWTSLFATHYDKLFWHHMLADVFRQMPTRLRTRSFLSDRLTVIRRFRNRVFHHERISHLPKLLVVHSDILETITWMNPFLNHLLSASDHFDETYRDGLTRVRTDLAAVVPA